MVSVGYSMLILFVAPVIELKFSGTSSQYLPLHQRDNLVVRENILSAGSHKMAKAARVGYIAAPGVLAHKQGCVWCCHRVTTVLDLFMLPFCSEASSGIGPIFNDKNIFKN